MAKGDKTVKRKTDPYVGMAVICEKVLIEPDNVPSAIRVVDTVILPNDPPPLSGTVIGLPLNMFIMFRNGDFNGTRELRIHLINPSGEREETGRWPIILTGPPEGGQHVRSPVLALKWDKEGLYIYEVALEATVHARIPLRVKVTQPSAPVPNPPVEEKPSPKRRRGV